jgi:hypothetical protein
VDDPDERSRTKVSPRLADELSRMSEPDTVDVVIELTPSGTPGSGTRAERVAAARSAFEDRLGSVTEAVTAAGGEVVDSAWLNQTVRGRLPAGRVEQVAADDAVAVVDLARPLEAEAQPATNKPSP